MEGFRFSIRQEVVLRDLDAFGHVNNAVFLTYIENGRVDYLKEVVGAVAREEIRNIMASVKIDFRAELSYREMIEIGVRAERMGRKSFDLAYRIDRPDGTVAAEARSVQVMYDFAAGRAVEVPPGWRQAIEAFEGRALDAS